MKKVEIYRLQNDGSQKILAVCKLVDSVIICEGSEIFVETLNKDGIKNYSKEKPDKLFPKDGLNFLEQLKNNFKSGYISASDILE